MVYELTSVRPILLANRAAGVPLSLRHGLIMALVDGVLWLLLIPFVFVWLDLLPLRQPVWLRHALGRLALTLVTMAIQAAAFCGILFASGWVSDLGILAAKSPLLGFSYQFETNVPPMLLASLAYSVARRVDAARRERRLAQTLAVSLADARLHALSAELQPHFLFNTMNAIAGLVRAQPAEAEAMLVQLSDLLRLTLTTGRAVETSLEAELERLDLYLGIQQMRFGPRLVIHRQVDAAALRATVPTLLLQPLVENALMHGLGVRRGPGQLQIECRRDGDRLVLIIQDDGVGMPAGGPPEERIGIGNTRARLAAMFGDDYRLAFSTPETGGTRATVTVPFVVSRKGVRTRQR